MALTRDKKTAQIQDLTQKFQHAKSVVFTQYLGLTVADVSSLRRNLKEKKGEMKVAKKSLIQLAAKNAGMPHIEDSVLDGAVACVFSFEDPIAGAQATHAFGKEHPHVKLVGGMFEGKILQKHEALAFATLPSRDQLLATFMSMIRSPLTSFASICNTPLRGFALSLGELAKKKATA